MTTLPGSNASAEGDTPYGLMLFVAGDEPNSRLARQNLAKLCEDELKGQCRLDIINVLEDFDTAMKYGILLTPTLLRVQPEPRVTLIGNLSNLEKVYQALHVDESYDG
jgi:circadian clock protein KaiB